MDHDTTCDLCYDEDHTAREHRYLILLGAEEAEYLGDRYASILRSDGWDVEVRAAGGGRAEGTYWIEPGRDPQILGYSYGIPADLRDAVNRAWDRACQAAE